MALKPVRIDGLTAVAEAERLRAEALFTATIHALRERTWELAERELSSPLEAALSEEPARQYARCVRALHVLVHVHWLIGPERSAAKVRTITDSMKRSGVRKTVAIAIRNYLMDNLLPYGAVLHVVESDFTLRTCDVQALLDRFGWTKRDAREPMHRLLCMALRTLADFRAIMEETAQETEDKVKKGSKNAEHAARWRRELETTLLGANERLKDSLERMASAHQDKFNESLIEMVCFEIGQRAAMISEEVRLRLEQSSPSVVRPALAELK